MVFQPNRWLINGRMLFLLFSTATWKFSRFLPKQRPVLATESVGTSTRSSEHRRRSSPSWGNKQLAVRPDWPPTILQARWVTVIRSLRLYVLEWLTAQIRLHAGATVVLCWFQHRVDLRSQFRLTVEDSSPPLRGLQHYTWGLGQTDSRAYDEDKRSESPWLRTPVTLPRRLQDVWTSISFGNWARLSLRALHSGNVATKLSNRLPNLILQIKRVSVPF